jgi:hypothetical protein
MFLTSPQTSVKVKTSDPRVRPSQNRIIDESMITQMSGGGELNKLRNNLA